MSCWYVRCISNIIDWRLLVAAAIIPFFFAAAMNRSNTVRPSVSGSGPNVMLGHRISSSTSIPCRDAIESVCTVLTFNIFDRGNSACFNPIFPGSEKTYLCTEYCDDVSCLFFISSSIFSLSSLAGFFDDKPAFLLASSRLIFSMGLSKSSSVRCSSVRSTTVRCSSVRSTTAPALVFLSVLLLFIISFLLPEALLLFESWPRRDIVGSSPSSIYVAIPT